MALNCGIVGLPNVGKSTIFSALSAAPAEVANYPFCTIDPNFGLVALADPRLERIAQYIPTQKIIPATVEFVDIAGLVQGASKGEGLGNRFLSHIRETNILVHVVRCFENSDIVHVQNNVDPARDIETIQIELALADIETVEKRLARMEKELRNSSKQERTELEKLRDILGRVLSALQAGKPVRSLKNASILDAEEEELIRDLHLITQKPLLYLCNVNEASLAEQSDQSKQENSLADQRNPQKNSTSSPASPKSSSAEQEKPKGNPYIKQVEEIAKQEHAPVVTICGQLEKDIASLDSEEDRQEFRQEAGLSTSGLNALVQEAYRLLGLRSYFTAGEKEVRSWTFHEGMNAQQCAGIIHSDFERGFIKAEVYHCSDLFEHENEQGIRKAGKLRMEGRDYIVQDGDVLFFKFNV